MTDEMKSLTVEELNAEYAGCGVHGGTVICD